MPFGDLAARRREQLLTLYVGDAGAEPGDDLADIVDLARHVAGAEGSQLNVLGAERQFTLHETGNPDPNPSVPLSASVCSTVLEARGADRLIVIPDTTEEPMLCDHPAVVGPHGIRFYAGVPLLSPHGWAIGMLCVWSSTPGDLDALQSRLLRQLGHAAEHALELRRRGHTAAGPSATTTGDRATPS